MEQKPHRKRNNVLVVPIGLTLLLLAVPGTAQSQGDTLGEVLARLATDPTIEEVQQAALRRAMLEPRRVRTALARVRSAGILPRVEASLDRGLSRDEDLDRSYEEMDDLNLATDQDLDFRVSLKWDLDRLVYDPQELRVRRDIATLAQRRRELLLAVTRMYYELLELRASELLRRRVPQQSDEALERAIRIAELRALLDGLTGGLFSDSSQR